MHLVEEDEEDEEEEDERMEEQEEEEDSDEMEVEGPPRGADSKKRRVVDRKVKGKVRSSLVPPSRAHVAWLCLLNASPCSSMLPYARCI
jgi:hypothetical protein